METRVSSAKPDVLISSSRPTVLIGERFNPTGTKKLAAVSGLGWNNIQMHAIVRPNDEISLKAHCLESKLSKSRPDCGVVTCRNELFNQRGELVFSAGVSLLVMCRPKQ